MRWYVALMLAVLAQNTAGNPFPGTGTTADFAVFNTDSEATLTGVIAQEITRADNPSTTYLYFRINVSDAGRGPTTWTVRMPKLIVPICGGPCLVTDYSPEMASLKSGMTVTVRGYRAKDGSPRLQLVATSGVNTLAGVIVGTP